MWKTSQGIWCFWLWEIWQFREVSKHVTSYGAKNATSILQAGNNIKTSEASSLQHIKWVSDHKVVKLLLSASSFVVGADYKCTRTMPFAGDLTSNANH